MSRNQSSKRSATFSRTLAVAPVAALTLWGCGTLIGLDSYTVASGGSGGAAHGGSAGTTSTTGGSAGNAAGGKSGSGGSTTVAGTSGIGEGGAPTVVGPNVGCDGKTSFTPNDNLVRSCVLRAGCSVNPEPVRTISQCVTKNTQAALPGESCNLASKTCDDFNACEHVGIAHDDLCGGTLATRCTAAGLAVNCGNYDVDQFYDCKAEGLTCGTYTFTFDDNTTALYADCIVPVTPTAEELDAGIKSPCMGLSDDTAYYCQPGTSTVPDAYYYCYLGKAYGESCSKFANCYDTTKTDKDGGLGTPDATCFFNFDAQCTGEPDSAKCANGVDQECSSESVISYDCTATAGLSCATKGTDGYCLAPGCKTADVDNCVESCGNDGTTLTFCYGGVPFSVDCTAYGFSACNEGTKKSDGTGYANCR